MTNSRLQGTKGVEDELAAQFEALQVTLSSLTAAAAKSQPGRTTAAKSEPGAAAAAEGLRPSTASTATLPPPPRSAVAHYGPKQAAPAAMDLASLLLGFADEASAPAAHAASAAHAAPAALAPAPHPLDGPTGVRPSSSRASARSRIGSARAFAAAAVAAEGPAV